MTQQLKSMADTFSPQARYLKATLIQAASGRYFVAIDGDLPKEAMFAEFRPQENTMVLMLENKERLTILQNIDAEFSGRIGKQKSISIVHAADDSQKMKLPLVVQ